MVSSIPDAHAGHTQHLGYSGRYRVNMKISIFKKVGVRLKVRLRMPAVSKLNPVCDLNQPLGAECFEMVGGLLGNQQAGPPMAVYRACPETSGSSYQTTLRCIFGKPKCGER
jgi:hypothetical protein